MNDLSNIKIKKIVEGYETVTINGKRVNFYMDEKTYLGCKEGIERTITPSEIGNATIGMVTEKKYIAMSRVNQDIQIVADKENEKEGDEL